jgi:hypothetical protein
MKPSQQTLSTFLILGSLIASFDSQAASYKRFWRGYSRPDLSSQQFVADVNNKIIPATRELFSKPSGLESYQPVISNMQASSHSPLVAAEFALLQYEAEDTYKKFRETPEGVAYGNLHWEMFDRTTSKSAVVEAYSGAVAATHAYDLLGQDIDWKTAHTYFTIYTRDSDTSEVEFLKVVENYLDETRSQASDYGLQALIVLVMNDHIAVYEAWEKSTSRSQYHEALDSDMPTGETSLRDVSDVPMDIPLHRKTGLIWPGQGSKIFSP